MAAKTQGKPAVALASGYIPPALAFNVNFHSPIQVVGSLGKQDVMGSENPDVTRVAE